MLPPATEAVWALLRSAPELAGFTLIGGTALALRIAHRASEDLDFVWLGATLPRLKIRQALERVEKAGHTLVSHDNPAALAEFVDSGLELHDHQQDYLVSSVKVSFFAADRALRRVMEPAEEAVPRVASLGEIFASKCLVSAQRSRTRDWFDLHALMRDHGFSLRDYLAVFEKAGDPHGGEIGLGRLTSGRPDRADEGLRPLVADPPSLEEMRDFFSRERDRLEVELASERLGKR
jgi:hypothetical protein